MQNGAADNWSHRLIEDWPNLLASHKEYPLDEYGHRICKNTCIRSQKLEFILEYHAKWSKHLLQRRIAYLTKQINHKKNSIGIWIYYLHRAHNLAKMRRFNQAITNILRCNRIKPDQEMVRCSHGDRSSFFSFFSSSVGIANMFLFCDQIGVGTSLHSAINQRMQCDSVFGSVEPSNSSMFGNIDFKFICESYQTRSGNIFTDLQYC